MNITRYYENKTSLIQTYHSFLGNPIVLGPGQSFTENIEIKTLSQEDEVTVEVSDLKAILEAIFMAIANPMCQDPATGRIRISLDALASGLTLGTVSTVTTVTTVSTVSLVTNISQIGGFSANQLINDLMHLTWGEAVRRLIT